MSEIEVPLEQSQEKILEAARESESKWFSSVALSSAILAVVAAVAALLAGHHSNEALLEQIQSSDRWAYYQAKGIKSSILASKIQLLKELGKKTDVKDMEKDTEKLEAYKHDQEEISKDASEKEAISKAHLSVHQTFAKSVTFFQIGIAVSAISVLIRRRRFWLLSLGFGLVGLGFFAQGFLSSAGGFH